MALAVAPQGEEEDRVAKMAALLRPLLPLAQREDGGVQLGREQGQGRVMT